jgi:polyphosphate kinase
MTEIDALFELAMAETTSSWHLDSNGTWNRHQFDQDGKPLTDVQDEIMKRVTAKKLRK